MAELLIIFTALTIISGLSIAFLFLSKNKTVQKVLFYFVAILAMLVAMMSAQSYPSNYIMEQVMAWIFGFVAIVGIILKCIKPNQATLAKVIVTLSLVLGLVKLIFL